MTRSKKRILALGAHPDDIEYGCGGTLLQYSDLGHHIFLYVLSNGEKAAPPEIRHREQEDAARLLGAKELFWGGFIDAELPDEHHIIQSLDAIVKKVAPDEVYCPFQNDTHQDHRKLARASLVATRAITKVICFDGWSTLDFNPNFFVDIQGVIDRKKSLLACHQSQAKRELEYSKNKIEDAVEATARFRGLQAKIHFAEAFVLVRYLRGLT